ncbi:MAG TPA: FAD-dependent oxidoreductase [Thermoleophilia bacterium]|nr:FAD-dependent oxidoreductase [Thermoleophilia bacterium]
MEKVECIVVGGGLAGLSAAYGLAGAGAEVMVLERGDYSGAKNVTGGRLYVSPIRGFYPELWEEAPFERPVARELITMMGDGAHTTFELASDRLAHPPQSYTVVRARLDQWLAEKVGEKGGMVVPGMKVDELLRKEGRIVGIRAGADEIGADVVVVAEGVLRLLAEPAGLAARPVDRDHALGYKEVIELPAGVIEDRWNLNPGEGAAQLFLGSVTQGMLGGGFLYTNKESISLGVVVGMQAMKADGREIKSHELLDRWKELPQIKPLVAGGTVAEYSAHAIPEGGIAKVPRLYGDGYVLAGDAAGLSLNALVTVRGMDFAIASGYYAAQAILRARQAGDFSAAGLAPYEAALRDSFVLKDLETARIYPQFMELPRLFTHYPTAVSRLFEDVFTIGPGPTPSLMKKAWKGIRRDFLNLGTLQDAWLARKL